MRIGVSIFLIALGAILRFALETSVEGINLGTTGMILMVVGAIGLVISLVFWSSFSPSRRRAQMASDGRAQVASTEEEVRDTETIATRTPEAR
ncbi:MAG: DUF6458 family protein [Nitriliruptoraceae bacterium]